MVRVTIFLALLLPSTLCLVSGQHLDPPNSSLEKDIFGPLRGRKLVNSWNGDLVDTIKSAAAGAGVGLAARAFVRLSIGISVKVACTATVAALWIYAGMLFFPGIADKRLNLEVPDVVLRTRDDLFNRIDTDHDGKITPNDFKAAMADVERIANRNLHSSFGAVFAFGTVFAFL